VRSLARLARLIKRQHPDWSDTAHICLADLNTFRMEYVRQVRKQSQRLFEIQQIQLDLMRDLASILPRG